MPVPVIGSVVCPRTLFRVGVVLGRMRFLRHVRGLRRERRLLWRMLGFWRRRRSKHRLRLVCGFRRKDRFLRSGGIGHWLGSRRRCAALRLARLGGIARHENLVQNRDRTIVRIGHARSPCLSPSRGRPRARRIHPTKTSRDAGEIGPGWGPNCLACSCSKHSRDRDRNDSVRGQPRVRRVRYRPLPAIFRSARIAPGPWRRD